MMLKEMVIIDRIHAHTKLLLLTLITIVMTACSNESTVDQSSNDDMNIISLIPSNTEIIAALSSTDDLVGITTVDTYPEDLPEDLTRLDTFDLDEEAMMALEPTHIISHASNHDANKDIIDRVADSTGAEVLIVDDAQSIDAIYDTITQVGAFIDKPSEAENLNTELQQALTDLKAAYEDQQTDDSVLLLVSVIPDIYVAGDNTFIDDFLETLEVENAFDDVEGYPSVTAEELIAREPTKVISTSGQDNDTLAEEISSISGLNTTEIADERNQCIPNPDTISRPGPRFVEGLEEVAQCIYE